ncbi:MAG: hypothetical protein ACKPKO_30735, partial [Candidatus Fonsibacter sp.]
LATLVVLRGVCLMVRVAKLISLVLVMWGLIDAEAGPVALVGEVIAVVDPILRAQIQVNLIARRVIRVEQLKPGVQVALETDLSGSEAGVVARLGDVAARTDAP